MSSTATTAWRSWRTRRSWSPGSALDAPLVRAGLARRRARRAGRADRAGWRPDRVRDKWRAGQVRAGAGPPDPGPRQRTFPRVPAGAAGPHPGGHGLILDLARGDVPARRVPDAGLDVRDRARLLRGDGPCWDHLRGR